MSIIINRSSMPRGRTTRTPQSTEFARVFGEAFGKFLERERINQAEAARKMGWGEAGKARINNYCHGLRGGKRRTPEADVLYLACVKLGFEFEYNGYKISAATLNGHGVTSVTKQPEQLALEYDRQFDLTGQQGTVSVSFRRPPGRVEVSVSLKAVS